MEYKIRQKIFSFGDNFTVNNSNDEPVLVVEGKVFSIGNKLKILDLNMNELFYIEQKIFKLLPEYNIYQNGNVVAHLKKEFSFLKSKIKISSQYGNFSIEGNLIQHNFVVRKDGEVVAEVVKKLMSFTDFYTLNLKNEENRDFMITLVIVIDQILHDNEGNK